jgi:hypothetical protein
MFAPYKYRGGLKAPKYDADFVPEVEKIGASRHYGCLTAIK